jgi:hypothetical protein
MEIIMTLIVLIIIFSIAFMVGAKQGANRTINQIKKDGGYYDLEYTSSAYPILAPTSSLDEVPKEFLMGGNIDRALHIAGVKEATPAKIAEWQDEKRAKIEAKQEASVDELLSKLNKTDLQIKAGLIENTDKTVADIKIEVKELDPIDELQIKTAAGRKQLERERVDALKRNFEALPLSRLSADAMYKIIELVREDIQNTMKIVEQNTPKINEDSGIGKKPKTQADYQREHKAEGETPAIDFMHNWIQEKSGKKQNPKQFNGIKTEEPFVKTQTKRKPKSVKENENDFDLGGSE